jgi:ZIP family zinc transporter
VQSFFVSAFGQYAFVAWAFFAGILASLACGLGALPLLFRGLRLQDRVGLGYAFAGGLMFSASVYNLLMPAFTMGSKGATSLFPVLQTLGGMAAGATLLWLLEKYLTEERLARYSFLSKSGGKMGALVFVAMTFHSIPEGVAVGVGYGSEAHLHLERFGHYVAIAIGIHNIPEGLAVALPMRLAGASIWRCFFFAFLTSLPQPIAAVPAGLLVWLFEPLMLPFLGFAAGAMIYLVLGELVPEALERHSRAEMSWMFLAGFGLMVLVQVGL